MAVRERDYSMKQLSMGEVIDQAMRREEESYALYEKLTGIVQDAASRDTLHFMAGEELKHKAALKRYKSGEMGKAVLSMTTVADARVVEALGAPDISGPLQHKDIFLFAAGREKASHEFYQRLAEVQPPGDLQAMLYAFAGEELRHKEKVEYLYCNAAFPQTDGG
jgi:rubrerythrin